MSSSNELSLSQCYSESTLHHTAFTWTIDHFSYRYECIWPPEFNKGKRTRLQLCLDPDDGGFLSLTLSPKFGMNAFAKLKVSLIDSKGEKILLSDEFHHVYDKSQIKLPKLISRESLLKPSNGYLPNDSLTIHCEIGFLENCKHVFKAEITPSKGETTQKAMEDYGSLLKSGHLADVKLLVGGKTLSAHKLILSVRSPVFAAMFAHDTKEKKEGQVEIPDVALEAFEALLEFLYTGAIPTLDNIKSAEELLVVADKYDAGQLKTICEEYLISQMAIETAPSLLLLASSVNADSLKKHALEFMRGRGSQLFDALQNDPEQLVNFFQGLAVKNQEKEQSK